MAALTSARQLRCAWFLAGLFAAFTPAWAQPAASEAGIKAAYLYKFLPYVDWPAATLPAADTPLVVGVAGAGTVHAELQGIVAGRQVNGRAVETRVVAAGDPLDGLHVLFVGKGASPPGLIERLQGRPTLVISDGPQGLEAGSMLNFIAVGGRIRFEASPPAAERAGIKLGARLLAVAERVVLR